MTITKLFCSLALVSLLTTAFSQETKKEEKKIQEVVTLDPISSPPIVLADGSTQDDTVGPKPINTAEILKRAVYFVKIESAKYIKSSAVTTGNKAECLATFIYKPKELNPQADVEGTITIHLSIEAKEGKYRYTISKLTHNSKNAEYTGGDIYNEVPKCGSMKLTNELWKRIRGEALKYANTLSSELKTTMKLSSDIKVDKDEW